MHCQLCYAPKMQVNSVHADAGCGHDRAGGQLPLFFLPFSVRPHTACVRAVFFVAAAQMALDQVGLLAAWAGAGRASRGDGGGEF